MTLKFKISITMLCSVVLLSWVTSASARDILIPSSIPPKKLTLISGKSVIFDFSVPIKKKLGIAVGDPEILTAIRLPQRNDAPPKRLYLIGNKAGVTNLTLWQEKELMTIYDIEVKYDISGLKKTLYESLPQEKDIEIKATNDSITLLGKVSNAGNLSKVLAIAESFVPINPKDSKKDSQEEKKEKINNCLTVGGTHQVMLEVKVAEMSKSAGKDLGVDVTALNASGDLGMTFLSPLHSSTYSDGELESIYSDTVNTLFRFSHGSTTWTAFIQALQEDGLAKILAEPNLISISGQTASFLAGGEYPIPVSSEDGIVIDYKEFGVALHFTPTVLDEKRISIKVNAEVSELDFTTALQTEGYMIPGITTRRAATSIQLNDGQSFAIAGLLSENIRENVRKFPFLGDIPILGTLFKSTSFQKDQTELVMIVTPRFVKPLTTNDPPLPTDYYQAPDDKEIFLNIKKAAPAPAPKTTRSGRVDGQFGHASEDD